MKKVDDFRFRLGRNEYVPIILGGMGVNISTPKLAQAVASLGGIGHLSDAMVPTVIDQKFGTSFVKNKLQRYRDNLKSSDKSVIKFDLGELAEATKMYVTAAMEAKKGMGAIFVNCMEKLTMANPLETLKVRLEAAMDAGIDGITLSAGLHLRTFSLIQNHQRFLDVKLGIIVSSLRALKLFLRKNAKIGRLPDYVIVEGPLAGGHLGFDVKEWRKYDLLAIVKEILMFLAGENLKIPIIPAGGLFSGSECVHFLEMGCPAVQVATRFSIARESGIPDKVKQEYFKAKEEDIVVNTISPTGYPMRMLKRSPAIGANNQPNCEAYGYLLDESGHCSYIDAYTKLNGKAPSAHERLPVNERTCLCTHMHNFKVWTCGHNVYRLRETARQLGDGTWEPPSAEHIFRDYQFSTDYEVHAPPLQIISS
uniref:Nitronate monooxygenase n=1 Tax=Candidatus Kentrum eta TaxID=2126337 RepID=A0A450VAF3_9GAMM|nr:MAG: nitronate monooxygenase [Candidatus Kentron sp. H]VFK01763.1 MAG: nitronate monooxygenase [Candidatus Kentron sp. H]VFK05133.1 MAG: nitronate monooxygenase [Candidatus Kentron sp. H]